MTLNNIAMAKLFVFFLSTLVYRKGRGIFKLAMILAYIDNISFISIMTYYFEY